MIRHLHLCRRLCSSLSKACVYLPERTKQLKLLPVRTYARDKWAASETFGDKKTSNCDNSAGSGKSDISDPGAKSEPIKLQNKKEPRSNNQECTKVEEKTTSCDNSAGSGKSINSVSEDPGAQSQPIKSQNKEEPGGNNQECTKVEKKPGDGQPDGGQNKLLLGLLVVAGGILAYLLWPEDDDKENKDSKKKKRRSGERLTRAVQKFPPTSADLPKKVHYLLIGGGTSSFSAFRSIKSLDPKAEVLVVASESEFPYMRPPLSKEMWQSDAKGMENLMFRQWNGSVRSVFYEPDSFYMDPKNLPSSSKGGVAVARGWSVKCIDTLSKQVTLDDGSVIAFEKCLLAPGSKPKPLPILENAEPDVISKVFYFRDIFDFKCLAEATDKGCKHVVIIGGGFLGSELACSLTHYGCKVTQVFRESGLLVKLLPTYLSKWLSEQVRAEGVNILSESEVTSMAVADKRLQLTLSNGKKIEADYCLVATGAVPNTDLAESSKLETHPALGGYLVNSEMLARSNLYVAGDAACFYDERYGRRRVEHHDHAVVSGRLAGENMVGAGKPYLHVSMLWSDLSPELGWEGVGILDPTLKTTGVFAKEKDTTEENFKKGVIFYRKDDVIVGILLWNVFNRMQLARQILKQGQKYDDMNEVAKLFNIHSE